MTGDIEVRSPRSQTQPSSNRLKWFMFLFDAKMDLPVTLGSTRLRTKSTEDNSTTVYSSLVLRV